MKLLWRNVIKHWSEAVAFRSDIVSVSYCHIFVVVCFLCKWNPSVIPLLLGWKNKVEVCHGKSMPHCFGWENRPWKTEVNYETTSEWCSTGYWLLIITYLVMLLQQWECICPLFMLATIPTLLFAPLSFEQKYSWSSHEFLAVV